MKVGCAAVFQSQELLKRLPNESSIYSAEVITIDLAMNIIANNKSSKFIICSNFKSVLQTLQSKDLTPLITRLLDKINTLSKNNSIILTWIPSHIGIQGNERADKAAKKAPQTHISNTKIPYTNLKPLINKFILKKWQKSWDDQTQNKLHYIQDTIGEWRVGYRRVFLIMKGDNFVFGVSSVDSSNINWGKRVWSESLPESDSACRRFNFGVFLLGFWGIFCIHSFY